MVDLNFCSLDIRNHFDIDNKIMRVLLANVNVDFILILWIYVDCGTCIVAWVNFDRWISALRDLNIDLCFFFTSTTRICAPLTAGTVGLAGSYFNLVVVFLPGTANRAIFLWNRDDRNLRWIFFSIRDLNFGLLN